MTLEAEKEILELKKAMDINLESEEELALVKKTMDKIDKHKDKIFAFEKKIFPDDDLMRLYLISRILDDTFGLAKSAIQKNHGYKYKLKKSVLLYHNMFKQVLIKIVRKKKS